MIVIENLEHAIAQAFDGEDILLERGSYQKDEWLIWRAAGGFAKVSCFDGREVEQLAKVDAAMIRAALLGEGYYLVPSELGPGMRFGARVEAALRIAGEVFGRYADECLRNTITRAMDAAGIPTGPVLLTMRQHRKYAEVVEGAVTAMLKEQRSAHRIGGSEKTKAYANLKLLIDGEDWTAKLLLRDLNRIVEPGMSRLEFTLYDVETLPRLSGQVELVVQGHPVFSGHLTAHSWSEHDGCTRVHCNARGPGMTPLEGPADFATKLKSDGPAYFDMGDGDVWDGLQGQIVGSDDPRVRAASKADAPAADAISDEEFWQRAGIPGPVPHKRLGGKR